VRAARAGIAMTAMAACLALSSITGDAHKPITSPYTFNEDVFPIVRERCGACHVAGGVGPMSLMTHAEAVPWGESLRAELMAGHMPPWLVESPAGRFRNVQGLTGRELNVLLTWASGGTPIGDPAKSPEALPLKRDWPLGAPDLVLPLPDEVVIPAEVQEREVEFTVPTGGATARWLRAVDLLPGTASIVRGATIAVKTAATPGAASRAEALVSLWLPGDHPVPLDGNTAFALPAGAELVVRVRYRKTWEYENRAMSDRSSIGLYFAPDPATALNALQLAAPVTPDPAASSTFTNFVAEPLRAVAIYADPSVTDTAIKVTAIRPDKSREELIAFRPQAGWARRYWFREPIALPRGTRIEVQSRADAALLPPSAMRPPRAGDAAPVRLTLNVVPAD
jgi:hypothetical protein